jgi:hypothetical protein
MKMKVVFIRLCALFYSDCTVRLCSTATVLSAGSFPFVEKKNKNVIGKYSSGVRFFVVAPAPCAGCVVSCTIDRRGQHCVGGDTPQATGQSGMNTLSYGQGYSHVAFTRFIHTWHSHVLSTRGIHTFHPHVALPRCSHVAFTRFIHTWHSHVSSTRGIHTFHPHVAFTRFLHMWHYRDVVTWHSHVSSTRGIHTFPPHVALPRCSHVAFTRFIHTWHSHVSSTCGITAM